MKQATPAQIIGNRALFLGLSMLGILFLLLPISMLPKGIIWPEFTFMAAMALVIRNPKYVPFWLIGFVFLISDFLLAQPLGLGAFIVVFACEYLRRNRGAFLEMLFFSEWFGIAVILFIAGILRRLLLAVTLAAPVPWWAFGVQLGLSVLSYPIVVGAISAMFRVSKAQETVSYPVRPST
jgi:rod shape-determining protein MreD